MGLTKCIAPAFCDNTNNGEKLNCGLRPYKMHTDECEFMDQQILKLQEAPELIPTGEMPRSLMLTCDRHLTDKCTPGNRVKVVGILSITSSNKNNADSNSNK
jgi:DNA replication licensing factor MCM5